MIKFDWYQATVYAPDPSYRGLMNHLMAAWELVDVAPDRGMHGYTHGAKIVRGSTTLCRLWWGGNPGVNVTASSSEAPVLAAALKSFGVSYGITRVDACADWVEEGFFDSVSSHLMAFAQERGLTINQQGDWVRGQARTLYVGSPNSPVRVCFYEKGWEQRSKGHADAPADWARLEVRLHPKGASKAAVAGWEPRNVFETGWVADAVKALGWEAIERRAVGTLWRPQDIDRARAALLQQYGPTLDQWASEEGSWEALGLALREHLATAKAQKVRA